MTPSRASSGDHLLFASGALTGEVAPESGGSLTRCDFKRREQIDGEDRQVIEPGQIWSQKFSFAVSWTRDGR